MLLFADRLVQHRQIGQGIVEAEPGHRVAASGGRKTGIIGDYAPLTPAKSRFWEVTWLSLSAPGRVVRISEK
jgi:hypothetical protein